MIAEAILSLLSGGATGLIGSAISKFSEFKVKKLEFAHDIDRANIETTHIKMESERDIAIANREAEAVEQSSADEVLKASYEADKATYLGKVGFIDSIRGLMRPVITLYMIGLTSWVGYTLYGLVEQFDGEAFDPTEAFALWREVIMLVLYLTTTAVTWWFGTRPALRK